MISVSIGTYLEFISICTWHLYIMYRYLVFIYNIFVLGSVINIKLKREYQITNWNASSASLAWKMLILQNDTNIPPVEALTGYRMSYVFIYNINYCKNINQTKNYPALVKIIHSTTKSQPPTIHTGYLDLHSYKYFKVRSTFTKVL